MTGVDDEPVLTISSTMRLAVSIGMAKPRPIEPACEPAAVPIVAMAEFTPITAPVPSSSGPPELPGLMAASVWIALMNEVSPRSRRRRCTGRFRALTMPVVTVPARPSGEPTAMTESPTASASERAERHGWADRCGRP